MKERDVCMDCVHRINGTDGKMLDCDAGLMYIPNQYCRYFELPKNYGEIMAKRSMEHFRSIMDELLKENPHFKPSFVESIKDSEKEESVIIEDLNKLFKENND